MEIIVLLKQVPATESYIEIADDGLSIKTADVKWVINPYDEFAVEEAVRMKEAHGGSVTIISVGKDKAVEAIRTALAMGADKGVLISDPDIGKYDNLQIAKILADAIGEMPYDVIIAGQRAVDDDNYLVGLAVAEYLKIPGISMVIKQDVTGDAICCRRTVDGGTVDIEAKLPVLLTTQRGLNEPRFTSMMGIMKAKKKPLDNKTVQDTSPETFNSSPHIKIIGLKKPAERTGGKIIEGESASEKAATLAKLLNEEAKAI